MWLFALLLGQTAFASNTPIPADAPPEQALGRHAGYLDEADGRLTLEQAIAAQAGGKFLAGTRDILNFGIGSRPVWIHFSVDNPTPGLLQRRLSVENAWLDQIDIHVRHRAQTVAAHRLGDSRPYRLRPVDNRHFALDHDFAPGISDVFIRVETPDPMAMPIYLMTPERAREREASQNYSYGFLYGFLFALLVYNVMLYAGLRKPQYILYSLYLGMFLLMNIVYTGYGNAWLRPDHTRWVQWVNPLTMMLYGGSGLIFALSFLHTRTHLPRAHKAVVACLGLFASLQLLAVLLDSQLLSLMVAFVFALTFTWSMLGLGVAAARAGLQSARYFLLAAIAAMVGAAMTTLSVWGFIPYNVVTFRAVEIGMVLDAALLALALAYQFRVGEEDKLRAEQLARLDPLTGINNRRAFYDKAATVWNVSQRNNRALSLILLDIDQFKQVNDVHGHAFGDEVLTTVSRAMMGAIRDQDVAARWGGEEFIVLLPETDIREAAVLAERLRGAIADILLKHQGADIAVTASLGVAQRDKHHANLDALISSADKCLYRSKEQGRNRVSHDNAGPVAEVP